MPQAGIRRPNQEETMAEVNIARINDLAKKIKPKG